MKKTKAHKYVCISSRKEERNSFGDLDLTITVELREFPSHKILKTETFNDVGYEGGGHAVARRYITARIQEFAKANGARRFTGLV